TARRDGHATGGHRDAKDPADRVSDVPRLVSRPTVSQRMRTAHNRAPPLSAEGDGRRTPERSRRLRPGARLPRARAALRDQPRRAASLGTRVARAVLRDRVGGGDPERAAGDRPRQVAHPIPRRPAWRYLVYSRRVADLD